MCGDWDVEIGVVVGVWDLELDDFFEECHVFFLCVVFVEPGFVFGPVLGVAAVDFFDLDLFDEAVHLCSLCVIGCTMLWQLIGERLNCCQCPRCRL